MRGAQYVKKACGCTTDRLAVLSFTMNLRRFAPGLLVGLAVLFVPPDVGAQEASAEPQHRLRLATLMPRTAIGRRGLTRWNRRLAELTEGRLQVQMYWGGAMGDERTMVRRMRIGSLDGASMTTMGLGLIYRPVIVMQAPGLCSTYAQVDAVRDAIGPELARGMEGEGFHLLGFGGRRAHPHLLPEESPSGDPPICARAGPGSRAPIRSGARCSARWARTACLWGSARSSGRSGRA